MTGSLADKPREGSDDGRAGAAAARPADDPAPARRYVSTARAGADASPAASASRPAPVTQTGPGGWTAAGGTPITVGADDSLAVIATRYGVPERAILSANGLSNASQVTPGRQIVIPVYNASVQAQAALRRPGRARAQTLKRRPAELGSSRAEVRRRRSEPVKPGR